MANFAITILNVILLALFDHKLKRALYLKF